MAAGKRLCLPQEPKEVGKVQASIREYMRLREVFDFEKSSITIRQNLHVRALKCYGVTLGNRSTFSKATNPNPSGNSYAKNLFKVHTAMSSPGKFIATRKGKRFSDLAWSYEVKRTKKEYVEWIRLKMYRNKVRY